MSIIETILAGGLAMVIAISFSQVIVLKQKTTVKINIVNIIQSKRNELLSVARNSALLSKSASLNTPVVSCLVNRGPCGAASIAFSEIELFNENNVLISKKTTDPNFGFDIKGKDCSTFSTTTDGLSNCPFRFVTKWKFMCSGASCSDPQIIIKADLLIDPDFTVPLNYARLGFTLTVGQEISSYERSCNSIGGTYSSGPPPSCLLPSVGPCPADPFGLPTYVVGFDALTQSKLCNVARLAPPASCPVDTVATGTDNNGNFVCFPIIIPPPTTPPSDCQVNPTLPECSVPTDGGSLGPPTDGGCGGGGGGC